MTDRELKLEEALTQILQWCMAYPETMFKPVSDRELHETAELLKRMGPISMDRLHGSWARHLLDGIGNIARKGLEP